MCCDSGLWALYCLSHNTGDGPALNENLKYNHAAWSLFIKTVSAYVLLLIYHVFDTTFYIIVLSLNTLQIAVTKRGQSFESENCFFIKQTRSFCFKEGQMLR